MVSSTSMLSAKDAVMPSKAHSIRLAAFPVVRFPQKPCRIKLPNCLHTFLSMSTSPVVLTSIRTSFNRNAAPAMLAAAFTTALSCGALCSTHAAIPVTGSDGIRMASASIAAVFTSM